MVVKFSNDGLNQSQIGLKLRDEYNIPLVKSIVGKSVGKILVDNNIKTEIPEDLNNMLNKAVILKTHLQNNNGDRKNIRSLELLEAKIHRLSKYYKSKQLLDKKWKYSTVVAQLS
jgi:small subunit ribosomal protein S15|tara:strand:- start:160 stop:504 length:345 start_codon:yes stop_codon:yes gene_type:complete